MKTLIVVMLLLWAVVCPALAQDEDKISDGYVSTAAELSEACKGATEDDFGPFRSFSGFDAGFDAGYCLGVIEQWGTFLLLFPGHVGLICPPDEATVGSGREIFVRYVENHPELSHINYTLIVVEAFAEAWPC